MTGVMATIIGWLWDRIAGLLGVARDETSIWLAFAEVTG